ncbi:MAG TPA: dihydrolipoamide acetyltransferase family protein [Ktedonobacterales bacterium]|jgi:2-oxoglutarate dehydrogenase dihydrolipoamide succinyltransferase (E2 component)
MATKITMPQLGESVAEGTVGRWLKQEGDTVKRDESLVEIITDKVTAELPSPVSGRLVRILVAEDQTVKVGVDIAEIEETGATNSANASSQASAQTDAAAPASASGATNSAPAYQPGATNGASPLARPAGASTATAERVSPLARRMAQEHNIDLNQVQGTGDGGRVRKEDIVAFIGGQTNGAAAVAAPPVTFAPAPPAAPTPPAPPVTFTGEDQVITPTPARRAIAEHMVRSKRTSPHATTLVEVDMTHLARWLELHKDAFKRREGVGVGFQTFAIKAVAEALKELPYLNASWTEDNKIVLRKQINIGVSIALENNLVVPVIRNADTLNLVGIARAVADLVARTRANRLTPADVQGATFTVNNPGVFGTLISMAIINQPNAGILTMDAVVKRPVVIDDAIAIRQMMYMSLSFDHRVIDGLTAARFLVDIKRRLETWTPEGE